MLYHALTKSKASKHSGSDPFLSSMIGELVRAGLRREPLGQLQVRWTPKAVPEMIYTAATMATSQPFLLAASSELASRERSQSRDAVGHHRADMHSLLRSNRGQTAAQLRVLLNEKEFTPQPPHIVKIPKVKCGTAIDLDTVESLWAPECQEEVTGTRPLVIASAEHRAMAASVSMLFGAYLRRRWHNSVVGFRAGIGVPEILAAFRQAVAATGRRLVLAADISDFFGSVDVDSCLNHLDGATEYRKCPDLRWLVDTALAYRPEKGLPQGNPLSPLLANIYATNAIDPACQEIGPHLRYVDDVALLCESEEWVVRAFSRINRHAEDFGLRLHPEKSLYHDLVTGDAFVLNQPNQRFHQPFVYLGVEIGLDGAGAMHFHLTNKAVRRLLEGLRETWFSWQIDDEHDRPSFMGRFAQARLRLTGWLHAYGFAEWTAEQEMAVQRICELACLDDTSLKDAVRDWLPRVHTDQEDQDSCIAAIAALCHMPAKERGRKHEIDDLSVFGPQGIGGLRAASKRRFEAALQHPADLPYGHRGPGSYWRHTVGPEKGDHKQRTHLEERGLLRTDPDDLPMPIADLVADPGRDVLAHDVRFPNPLSTLNYTATSPL